MNDKFFILFVIICNLVLSFSISYIFISYTKSLENKKCNCSNDIRRKYLKYYGYFFLLADFIFHLKF